MYLSYFTATLGLGRTGWGMGWEMQVTDSEEMEKKENKKLCF